MASKLLASKQFQPRSKTSSVVAQEQPGALLAREPCVCEVHRGQHRVILDGLAQRNPGAQAEVDAVEVEVAQATASLQAQQLHDCQARG
jgi:hypothetical protein